MQPQVGKTRSRRKLLTASAAILLLCGAWTATQGPAAPAESQPITIAARPMPLDKNDPGREAVGDLTYLGGIQLLSEASAFGGYSGLRLLPDGRLLAISDRGHWLAFRTQEQQGRLVGLTDAEQGALLDETGRPLAYPYFDAEALEVVETPEGGLEILVAFEQRHRIWRYSSPGTGPARVGGQDAAPAVAEIEKAFAGKPATLPWLDGWPGPLPANAGLEAMAVSASGAALLLAEGTGEGRFRPHAGAPWVSIRYSAEPGFKPTDAVFLPVAGRHLAVVVNRYFSILHGVAARLELLDLDTVLDGRVEAGKVKGRLLARLAPPVSVDNMEAVAVVPHPEGGWSLYLMADDNQNPLQRTLLLKFRLPASVVQSGAESE